MVKNIEKTITRLAASVHSPKNRFATKNAYGELCRRIGIRAMSANDADRSSRRLYMRTAVAASLALVVGIGIACISNYDKWFAPAKVSKTETTAPAEAKRPDIVFKNQPMKVIAQRLSKEYNVKIIIKDNNLAEYKVTATFSPDENIDDIISILSSAAHFNYTKNNNVFVLRRSN
jgi:ferric-dicitrate binding protein FerR (iron transport regulator)